MGFDMGGGVLVGGEGSRALMNVLVVRSFLAQITAFAPTSYLTLYTGEDQLESMKVFENA